MPIFTLESVSHPKKTLRSTEWYSVDLLVPGYDVPHCISGYLTPDRFLPAVSRPIAEKLAGTRLESNVDKVTIDIVIQTKFEGDLVYHRTRRIPVTFKIIPNSDQSLYFHLPSASVEEFFLFKQMEWSAGGLKFGVLTVVGDDTECSVIPLELGVF
jgi:hypothetical protein